jgi:2-amino-4-hydroxy-6-hydroxymethyldihydropteridine diphosphokinase
MSDQPFKVAIALGSNLRDRDAFLRDGAAAIASLEGVWLTGVSQVEETDPIGPQQPKYLNQMVLVETVLTLASLLTELRAIEARHGRDRTIIRGPRTLDLDIVWADGVIVTSAELLVPHPGLTNRAFWQRELAELLGVGAATEAIASAQVHAGRDTSEREIARHQARWSGGWDIIA